MRQLLLCMVAASCAAWQPAALGSSRTTRAALSTSRFEPIVLQLAPDEGLDNLIAKLRESVRHY
jgi:hypothetical protein